MNNQNESEIKIRKEDDANMNNEMNERVLNVVQNIHEKQNKILSLITHPYFPRIAYSVMGLLLFGALFIIFNTYILHVKIDSAVVSTPIETIVAPASGYIETVYVASGALVKKGAPLFKIGNLELERDYLLARVQLEESQQSVIYYKNLLANEQQRLRVYRDIGSSRVKSAQSLVSLSHQDLVTAKRNLERLRVLHTRHYLSDANWDNEVAKYHSAQERLKEANAQHEIQTNSLNATDKGLYFTGTKIEGSEKDLNAELNTAEQKLKISAERMKIYGSLLKKLIVPAPFDGKVTQVLKSAGNTTDTVKPILFLEHANSNKKIIAYLTQQEIARIGSTQQVKVFIPALGKSYLGKITEINRTDGFIDVVKAQYRWRDFEIDRSAMVTIDSESINQQGLTNEVFAGMPVIVYFSRRFGIFL